MSCACEVFREPKASKSRMLKKHNNSQDFPSAACQKLARSLSRLPEVDRSFTHREAYIWKSLAPLSYFETLSLLPKLDSCAISQNAIECLEALATGKVAGDGIRWA